jgi:hypothetical protein
MLLLVNDLAAPHSNSEFNRPWYTLCPKQAKTRPPAGEKQTPFAIPHFRTGIRTFGR